MKRSLILIPAFVFLVQISKAQTEKGSQTLGVNLSFNYSNETGIPIPNYDNSTILQSNKYTSFSAGPAYSYFIADNLDLGTTLNYSLTTYGNGDNSGYYSKQSNRNYGGNIFIRKYFLYKNKLGFRVEPYLGYSFGDQKVSYTGVSNLNNNTDEKSHTYQGGANLDMVYFPSKHLGLSVDIFGVSYYHTKPNGGEDKGPSTDQVSANFLTNNLALSLLYVFGGK